MSDRSLSKLQIDADTVFQVEVNSARNEVVARLGFERTLLTLQIQVLAGTLAAFATITQGKFQLTPYYIEIACAIVLWISFALQYESVVNQSWIVELARFLDRVINDRYEVVSAIGKPPWVWEKFWYSKHGQSAKLKSLTLSLFSPPLMLNLLLSMGAISVFWYTFREDHYQTYYMTVGIAISGIIANFFAIVSYFLLASTFTRKMSQR